MQQVGRHGHEAYLVQGFVDDERTIACVFASYKSVVVQLRDASNRDSRARTRSRTKRFSHFLSEKSPTFQTVQTLEPPKVVLPHPRRAPNSASLVSNHVGQLMDQSCVRRMHAARPFVRLFGRRQADGGLDKHSGPPLPLKSVAHTGAGLEPKFALSPRAALPP